MRDSASLLHSETQRTPVLPRRSRRPVQIRINLPSSHPPLTVDLLHRFMTLAIAACVAGTRSSDGEPAR
jgi:hypothetical protein